MIQGIEQLETLLDRVEYCQNLLISHSTEGAGDNNHYQIIRQELLANPTISHLVPGFIRVNRDLSQFWQFIKYKYSTYKERREFIWSEFSQILQFLESSQSHPAQTTISNVLKNFDHENIHFAWGKALERKANDPEGAITMARTILESVCKHILDEKAIEYDSSTIELSELYKLTANELNLAPEQHNEKIFRQILGGCSGIVNGLGTLRNKLGDAHGKGKLRVKPKSRHAELAVNLAGAMALFLVSTFNESK